MPEIKDKIKPTNKVKYSEIPTEVLFAFSLIKAKIQDKNNKDENTVNLSPLLYALVILALYASSSNITKNLWANIK